VLIDKQGIARLIPHAGLMCLLDGVLSWDGARIICETASHRAADNPLRRDGRLGILCGVEYAAQAMALHGALGAADTNTSGPARVGYLASLRALACHTDRLDQLAGALIVETECLHGEPSRAIHGFSLRHEDRILLSGRAAVMLADSAA
jgi:predicted hotdog family 3-hydroxylacyl-ACP dehydratase